ncbi:hypothetical protein PIB30_098593, partial [Stylosanthes scabra]|nr:hypothetical protein [Stylosanthes scabra]
TYVNNKMLKECLESPGEVATNMPDAKHVPCSRRLSDAIATSHRCKDRFMAIRYKAYLIPLDYMPS